MGSRFEFIAVGQDSTECWAAILDGMTEVRRIEQLISSWDPNSQTSAINRAAGKQAVKVDQELLDLINRAQKVSALTEGAFDISFAAMDQIWKFDGSTAFMPPPDLIQAAVAKVNWQNILIYPEKQMVFLKEEGMKIGFGAIGKGYAANKAKAIMEKRNIQGGLVNAGGDLIAWGKSDRAEQWSIKIADPKDKKKAIAHLNIENGAIVTSGDYERFTIIDGVRYAHIIDPRTGYPSTGIKSVSVLCPDAELADALATAIFVMGKDKGIELVNQLKQIECLIITDKDELLPSKGLILNEGE